MTAAAGRLKPAEGRHKLVSASVLYKGKKQAVEVIAAGALAESIDTRLKNNIPVELSLSDLQLISKALRLLANVEASI